MENIRLLVIDDDEDVLKSLRFFLEEHVEKVFIESDPRQIPSLLSKEEIDIVLLDMNYRKGEMDGSEGLFWLKQIQSISPDTVVIPITAFGDVELAVQAVKEGAFDFILKPWKNAKLLSSVISASKYRLNSLELKKLKYQKKALHDEIGMKYPEIIGESEAMLNLKRDVERIAHTEVNVLILGENGTGKELVARWIHKLSKRNTEIFVGVDLGAISESLFETEMFGHVKGAYTDAKEDRIGRFEMANGGTIFLDEIGNLSYPLQSKLLTTLEQRKITRVGSGKEIPVDFRLVCATNKPLQKMVEEGSFRRDLYHRINTFEVTVPPLRKRSDDITILAYYFLKKYSRKYNRPNLEFESRALKQLQRHNWPGNVRELQNAIERAIVLTKSDRISFDSTQAASQYNTHEAEEEIWNLDENEKRLIIKALEINKGNVTKAAKMLGLNRNALYRRMDKYEL